MPFWLKAFRLRSTAWIKVAVNWRLVHRYIRVAALFASAFPLSKHGLALPASAPSVPKSK